jgi:PAS domain S-box-containing protein
VRPTFAAWSAGSQTFYRSAGSTSVDSTRTCQAASRCWPGGADGEPAEKIEYDLDGTPCAEVLTGITCFHATGVSNRFPLDRMLTDLGVDSYAGTPLRGVDGQAHGLLVIMHDRPMDESRHHHCTILDLVAGRAAAELERSRVEEQLRRSEEQIRFLSESTPALLWRATPDGRLDYLSPRAAEYCGVPIESLLGYGYVAHMHPDDVSHKLRLWKAARETGSPFEAEYRLRGVSGTYRWQLTRAATSPARSQSGTDPSWTWTTNGEPKKRCARLTAARTSSWPCSRTSCATLSHPSVTP